jgi:hypothetical protein
MTAVLVEIRTAKALTRNVKQSQIVLGVTVLILGILSVVPAIRATEPPEVGASSNVTRESAAAGEDAVLSLSPFRKNQNLTLGAVTESSAEAAEADKLAKEQTPNNKANEVT